MSETVFRRKVEEEPETKPEPRDTPNLTEGREDGALQDADSVDEVPRPEPLDEWEIRNGKYGHEYFGIKELANEFPLKANFGVIDKYVRELITESGQITPEAWQKVVDDMENEIGTRKLNPYDRIKRLAEYVKVMHKIRTLNAKKRMFTL